MYIWYRGDVGQTRAVMKVLRYQRRIAVKKVLLSILIAALLFSVRISPVFGGVEPSPFMPDIGLIQSRLILIGDSFDLSDTTRDSLAVIDLRLASLAENPDSITELTVQGMDVIDRISAFLTDTDAPVLLGSESSISLLVNIMDRISWILFDPQPEPPGYIADGFTVLYRMSWISFDPQPEPPGMPQDLQAQSISIMYQVASVLELSYSDGFQSGTIPAMNALEKLSGGLVEAVGDNQPDKAAAQLNAMSRITEQYAGY
jgi:hypothetical protein